MHRLESFKRISPENTQRTTKYALHISASQQYLLNSQLSSDYKIPSAHELSHHITVRQPLGAHFKTTKKSEPKPKALKNSLRSKEKPKEFHKISHPCRAPHPRPSQSLLKPHNPAYQTPSPRSSLQTTRSFLRPTCYLPSDLLEPKIQKRPHPKHSIDERALRTQS